MTSDTTHRTLLELHPELKTEWQNDASGTRAVLEKLHNEYRKFDVVSPLSWNMPPAVSRANNACGEIIAAGVVLHTLAQMEYSKAKSYDQRSEASEKAYGDLVMPFSEQNIQMLQVQMALENLEVVSEYRWLQANVEGDFSTKPASERANFTQTSALLNDRRMKEVKATAGDPRKLSALEVEARQALGEYRACLENLSQTMKRVGPVYGLNSAQRRQVAVRDHEICTDILIPYMQDSIQHVEAELTALGRLARVEGATRVKAADGMAAPNVATLKPKPRSAHTATPDPNAVDSIVRVDFTSKKRIDEPSDQPYMGGERERRAWQVREENNNPDGHGPTRRH